MLVVYMRLISLTDFKPVTHFLPSVHVLDGKAETVTEAILKALKERLITMDAKARNVLLYSHGEKTFKFILLRQKTYSLWCRSLMKATSTFNPTLEKIIWSSVFERPG